MAIASPAGRKCQTPSQGAGSRTAKTRHATVGNVSASIETRIDRIGAAIYSVVAMHTWPVVTKVRVERSRSIATRCIVRATPTIRRYLSQSVVNVVGVGIVGKRPKHKAWVTLRARRHAGTTLHHRCSSSQFLCTDRVVIEERAMTLNPSNCPNRHTFLCEYISDVEVCCCCRFLLEQVMARPWAESERRNSGSMFSRVAQKCISSVTIPCLAKCI
jgi:hypothetical protein